MNRTLEHILPKVQKPARYTGGEYNAIVKDRRTVDTRYALCFPDTYEIGMSNLGCRILYGLMNEVDGLWCERCYAPWGDMEDEMRREGLLLYGLESGAPISDFDIIGFSLGYEMAYSNVLNMLDLAGLPLRSADRPELTPLIVAGGTCAYNPEPLADFFDIFYNGEGETVYIELMDRYKENKKQGRSRREFLEQAAEIEGIYVPAFYDVEYHEDGTIKSFRPNNSHAKETITKQLVVNMDDAYYIETPVVPFIKATQDRVVLEIQRGCIRGCRFCQAGNVYRPLREHSLEYLKDYAYKMLKSTGHEEISLSSLSSSDYTYLEGLVNFLIDEFKGQGVNISLPSLRIDAFSLDVMSKVQDVKKSSLTFAPEAGSQRLRDVIN